MKADRYVSVGVPVIRGLNISDTRTFRGEFVYVSDGTADELAACNVFADDLVFPHRGAIGLVGIVPSDANNRYMLSTSLMKLTCDTSKVDPRFLYYFFRSSGGRNALLAHASTVGTPGIGQPLASLRGVRVPVPPLDEQRKVSAILGTLDDKIELNRRMSETLEAMARALFKSWFVDFDPVRAKAEGRDTGLPKEVADLFPDSFEDSELGEIPKGWGVGVLGDVAEHPRRSVKPDELDPETPYIALEHMPRRATTLGQWGCAEGVESNKHAFEQGEILFGKLRPYFHKVGVAPVSGICSTDIVVLRPIDPEMHGFVLGVVTSDEFVDITSAGATGTRMPRTNWDQMKDYPVVVPSPAVAYAFDRIVGLGIRRAIAGTHESLALAQLRDTLLPELITRRNVGLVTG